MTIRTAILGYGRSGSSLHADPLEKLSGDFTVAAVCDTDPDARRKAAERFPCRVYEDYRAMLSAEALDLVVVVTRSAQHCAMTCDCLRGGANVLVTKPWALDAAEAEAMIAAAGESGRKLLPWLPARWGSDLARLRELVASGRIGRVFQIRRREFNFGIRHDWQTERKQGGGYLLNWGPHVIDQPMQLAGEPVRSVYGQLRQLINPGDVEDLFHAVLITESGVLLTCEYTIAASRLPQWVVQGDRGTIFVQENSVEVHQARFPDVIDPALYGNRPAIEVAREELQGADGAPPNRYGDALVIYREIARALRGETEYPVGTASALELTRVLDAVRASSARNEVVRL